MLRRVIFICLLTTLLILSKDVELSDVVWQQGPMFTSSFSRDLTFLNTKGAVLPCSAYGRPNPQIEWISQSGKKLVESPGLLEILSNGSLHFKPFREEQFDQKVHGAVVRCRAVNSVGSVISPEIHIKSVPISHYQRHNVQVNDAYVTVNNTAILHCSVNPYYLQKYVLVTSWIQNGRTIAADERYSLLRSGELHVRQVLRNDSYSSYRCVTRNSLTGEEKTSDPAHLIVVDSVNSGPVMKNALSSISAVGGSAVELPCVANGVPLPQFSWSKDGVPLTIQSGKFFRRGGNLVISGADVRDSGNYVCTAKNDFGRTSLTLQLEVYDPLRAHIEPSELTVDLNGSAVFNCITSGHPVKTIQWYKDGQQVTLAAEDDHLMSSSSSGGAVLEISRIQRQDAGMYQCLVSNDEDGAQGSAQLLLGVEKPIVVWSSDEEYAQIGRGASLRCSASGRPVPLFQWTVDDVSVVNSSNVKVSSYVTTAGDVVSHVNISSVSLEDGGSYRCTVLNKAGTDFREMRLNVYGIPFIRPMNDLTRVANELLVLPCYVTGYPVHRITWYKGNVQLPINHRQYIRPNGALVIDALDRYSDEGVYVCDARDARGQGMNRSVYVRIMEPPKIDPFQFPRRKQGDRVSISCIISSGDLPLNITWLKNGLRITPDNGVSIQKTGAYSSLLSISYVDQSHSGNFTCTASNSAASVSHSAQLSVNVAPQWRVEPENSVVVLGRDVVIDCQTDGDPLPIITWKKTVRGQMAQYVALKTGAGSDDDRVQQMGNGSLCIRAVELMDDGQYLCQSSNGVGPDLSKVVLLSVRVPAHFKMSERNYTVRLDDSVTIECVADGDLPMSVVWSYALEALKDRSRMQTTSFSSNSGSGSRLLISSVRREDTGFYVCSAENVYGSDVFTALLVVVERADPPRDLVVVERGSHHVRLNWVAGFDGNSPITGWTVQVRTEEGAWQNATAVTFDVGGLSADVTGLKPATVYEASISASNQLGFGRPSNAATFKTAESEPSGAPRDVVVRAIGSRSLKITWKPPEEEFKNGKIIGYHVGYKKNSSDSPYLYITKRLEESCVLENLEKFTYYAVHIQALTAVGHGPRSDDVISMTLEDVPSHHPDEVKAVAVSSESILVSWASPPLSTLHGNLEGFKVVYRIAREDEDETDATTIVTKKLSVTLVGLRKYTNYSIQLMAYTRMGEGVASPPIHVVTLQSTPDMPADVKAVVAGSDKVLVSWKPPLHANGVLTKYTVYRRDITSAQAIPQPIDVHPSLSSHMVSGLSLYYRYGFRVSASTAIGESESTREIVVSTVENVSARIASFSSVVVYVYWYGSVFLHCLAVGVPPPNVTWKKRGVALSPFGSNSQILPNGTLVLSDVQSSDAAEYTCRAENENGADEITASVVVQVPPRSPVLSVSMTTSSSIQIVWRTASNGGSRISGFSVFFRHHESSDWSSVDLGSSNRSYVANDLLCGSEYSFYIRAHNRMGEGVPSNIVSVKTNGSSPIMPPQSLILSHVNSTFAILAMDEWQIADCPILFYDVQYQIYGDSEWHYIQQLIHPNVTTYQINLHPSTWYIVKVTAHSSAGSTECILKFTTKAYFGATVEPIRIEYRRTTPFYKNIYVMLSASVVLVVGLITAVAVGLYCRRWQLRKRYRATASRLHRDPKTAFALPSDADKLATSATEDRRDIQTYIAAPSLTHSALRLVASPRAGVDVRASECSDESALQDRILCNDENDPFDENQDRINEDKIEEEEHIAKSMSAQEDDLSICPYATFPLSHQLSSCHPQNRYDNLNEMISSADVATSPPQEITNDAQKSQYQNFQGSLRRGSNVPPMSSSVSSASSSSKRSVRSAHPPPPPIRRTLTLSRDITSRAESLTKE